LICGQAPGETSWEVRFEFEPGARWRDVPLGVICEDHVPETIIAWKDRGLLSVGREFVFYKARLSEIAVPQFGGV
jgi:hypothetical protein